jgi:flagellar basal body-associated protein FliL
VHDATKQWLLIVFLAASLAAMVALVLWQMAKAQREAPARPEQSHPAPGLEESGATHPSVHIVFFKPRSGD